MSSTKLPDIRQTQILNAPIEKVWKAVTTPEGFSAWFMPGNVQPVVGHEFLLEAGPFGQSPCKVLEVEAPRRMSIAWAKDWTLTFELADLGEGRTEFTLIHGGWDAEKVTEFGQPHPQVREHMGQGWTGIGRKLAQYVEG
ncbi:SRPBCC family protein [Cohnella caldifontis]|uniref:SRPBCC family protein n=1 Tax=Cohnella caldifontis TaxID=3027471 RepID=UPI0023EBD621|nr:SRPBCC domain-containing protein [Cohnella sp. YIM B05605]